MPFLFRLLTRFAGQAEYQSTNAMFLSGGSIILLCIDMRKHSTNEQRTSQILYWLSALNTAAAAHDQCLRVIVCGTHCDDMHRNDRTPLISSNDTYKLRAFEKFITVEKHWFRLNGRNITCNHIAALRNHCTRMGLEMSAASRI